MNSFESQRYIKSFSKGQVTIPKEFRDFLGLGDIFWLKLNIAQNKIIAEPIADTSTKKDYAKKLLGIKGKWFSAKEWAKNRQEIESRAQ